MSKLSKKYHNFFILRMGAILATSMLFTAGALISVDMTSRGAPVGNIEWSVTVNLNEPGGAEDYVVFGEAPDAYDGPPVDSYDAPKPPTSMPPYLRVWLNDNLAEPYNLLLKDYRKYPDTYKVWNLSVQWVPSDYVTPTSTTISWDIGEVDDSEYSSVILYDDGGNPLKDMFTQNSYSFTCPAMTPQSFTIVCEHLNNPPDTPSNPDPDDGATNIDVNAILSWNCSDPDPSDTLTYDVYFGTASSPLKVSSNQSATTYYPGTMNYEETYYWKIIAWDNRGAYAEGPIWDFTTEDEPLNFPLVFSNENPSHGSTDVPVAITSLSVLIEDPEGDSFDWSIETSPDIGSSSGTGEYNGTKTCTISGLNYDTTYIWFVNATDSGSGLWTNEVYTFTTESVPNNPPNTPSKPSGETDGYHGTSYIYSTSTTDSNGDNIFYFFDWDDDTNSGWIGPYANGEPCSISHTWQSPGTYNISVKAKDVYGEESDWSPQLLVTMKNRAPNTPSNPSPINGTTGVDINAVLSWTGGDPDTGDIVTYDIYFGTESSPPKIVSKQSSTSFAPSLSAETTYYWKIVAWDNHGAYSTGPIWSFTTENNPPNTPSNPTPANHATGVDINANLYWSGGDPDPGDTVTYDVYFGDSNPPPQVVTGQSTTTYNPGTMDYPTKYYWKIVSWDNHGASTTGPVWDFTTGSEPNDPPNPPSDPSPDDGATDVSVNTLLGWNCSDPDGNPLVYDVYLEADVSTPDILVSDDQTGTTYNPGDLVYGTIYYWQIIAKDSHSASTTGPVWSFTTASSSPGPGPGPGPGPSPPEPNVAPTANASASETVGLVGSLLTFDGSQSFDQDGYIKNWSWDFGDGTNGTGEIVTHAYSNSGTYNVTLTVTDNDDAKDEDSITVVIGTANNPPSNPIITGETTGNKNVEYQFTATSTDLDNDSISYTFNWGDGNTSTTELLPNGTSTMQNHTWTSPGIFIVSVYAEDQNNAISDTVELTVLIDVQYCDNIGHIIDSDSDGIYDLFYSNMTGNKTVLGQKDESYLIDSDGDGNWDYVYNQTTETTIPFKEETIDEVPWAVVALIVIALAIISLIVYFYKKGYF